jgi:hypothetical protein
MHTIGTCGENGAYIFVANEDGRKNVGVGPCACPRGATTGGCPYVEARSSQCIGYSYAA